MLYVNIIIGIVTATIQIITLKLPIIILIYKNIYMLSQLGWCSSNTRHTPAYDISLESGSLLHSHDACGIVIS